MIKMLKIAFLVLIVVAIAFGLYVLGSILYATVTDYQPPESEVLEATGTCTNVPDSTFRFIIWNIGYSGLGAEMDFFYDGGKSVRAPKNLREKYWAGIQKYTSTLQNVDFVLLQEVDQSGKRSGNIDQVSGIGKLLPNHCYSFAPNYRVKFIPIPFTNPMGGVNGGLVSLSKHSPSESKRFQFPGNFGFPKRLFFLDRCFLLQRIPLNSGKDLVVINTHNSAYDDGTLKAGQMAYLKEKILSEYAAGHYVVVGGDWNQCPPDFDCHRFSKTKEDRQHPQSNIENSFLPAGWQWVYDGDVPTNRKLNKPFEPDRTFTTVIDFYLVSPNITVKQVTGVDQGFALSDHQPVFMEIELN